MRLHLNPVRPAFLLLCLTLLFAPIIPASVDRLVLASADTAPLVDRGEGFYERLVEAASGRVDSELGRTEGLETSYATRRQVPYPLTGWRLVAFSAVPEYPATFSFEEVQELRIAYINVWMMYDSSVFSSETTIRTNSEDQLFQVLLFGRVDLALYSADRGDRRKRPVSSGRAVETGDWKNTRLFRSAPRAARTTHSVSLHSVSLRRRGRNDYS